MRAPATATPGRERIAGEVLAIIRCRAKAKVRVAEWIWIYFSVKLLLESIDLEGRTGSGEAGTEKVSFFI